MFLVKTQQHTSEDVVCLFLQDPAYGTASIRPCCVSSHKWPFNRLFCTLTPRLLLPPLSLFLLYTCVRLGPLICERALPSYGHTGLCLLLRRNASFSASLTCLFVAMVSPPLKYIFLLLAWMFFYLRGLEPVAPRARFKCVWVFKDFSAEKPFGLQPHRHTSATELCHFRFLSHRWNQRKVQKRSKKHKTKADENGPDWIMSDLACASLWGKSSFCLITLCLTAKWIKKK